MGTMVGQWFQKILFWDNALSLFSAVSKSTQSPTRLPEIYSQIRKPLSQRAQHRKSLDYQCFAGFFATGTMSKALSHCPSPFSEVSKALSLPSRLSSAHTRAFSGACSAASEQSTRLYTRCLPYQRTCGRCVLRFQPGSVFMMFAIRLES